jgi:hypothetical protein
VARVPLGAQAMAQVLVTVLVVSLVFVGSGCCPDETEVYPILFDGGVPDEGVSDAGCAAICYDMIFVPGGGKLELRGCAAGANLAGNLVVDCSIRRICR